MTEGTKNGDRDIGRTGYGVTRLACAMWVLGLTLLAISTPLNLFIPTLSFTGLPNPVDALVFSALILGFSTIGVLITTRQPRNLIGWIMFVSGVALGATLLSSSYVDFSLVQL